MASRPPISPLHLPYISPISPLYLQALISSWSGHGVTLSYLWRGVVRTGGGYKVGLGLGLGSCALGVAVTSSTHG